jgi:molecular chaperone GrpE (heat shock protein)
MALRHHIQYLRKEHEELLHLADRIEKMLESASKNDFAEHLKSLTGLRSLEHGLAGIVEHCGAEDRIIESTYHRYLQQDERARIDAEDEQIIRAVTNFREELKCATTDRTMAMILPGMDAVNRLRAHIAYEREPPVPTSLRPF